MRLAGKVAIISGAASGMGTATARMFAREGAKVVIADMLEHEADYSQYTGDLTFARYKASRAYRKFRTDLYGAQVTIYYVQRQSAKPINSADHIRFWADWIRDNNGRLKQATKLQGVG